MQQVLERIVDENAVPLGQGLLAKGAPSAAKTGARKALGNLTNTKPSASIATAGKQRRAFGEVRSIAKSENADCSAAAKPAATVAVAAVESKGEDLAARYAAEGVEQLAGKGWHQLERERYAREDAEISASVKQMAAGLATWSSMLPAFQPVSADEADAPLVMEALAPEPPCCTSGPRAAGAALAVAPDDRGDDLFALDSSNVAGLLPDVGGLDGAGAGVPCSGGGSAALDGIGSPMVAMPW